MKKLISYLAPAKKLSSWTVMICLCIIAMLMIQSCSIVRPGETAVKTKLGKYKNGTLAQGIHFYDPFTARVIKFNLRITDYSEKMHLPTKEGLEINTAMTVLYHIQPEAVQDIYAKFGKDYATPLITNNLYAIVRQSTIAYSAQDIITQREDMEKAITDRLVANVSPYGIVVDKVLLKDIILPTDVTQAIANKVKAQQIAQQAEFDVQKQRVELNFNIEKQLKEANLTVDKQKIESERAQIEAEAVSKAQKTINESITDKTLKYKSLEVTKGLITSPNAKIIISNGNTPYLINNLVDEKFVSK